MIFWADNNATLHAWRVDLPLGGDAIDHTHISRLTSVAGWEVCLQSRFCTIYFIFVCRRVCQVGEHQHQLAHLMFIVWQNSVLTWSVKLKHNGDMGMYGTGDILNASVAHLAATQLRAIRTPVDQEILSIRKKPMLSGFLIPNASILSEKTTHGLWALVIVRPLWLSGRALAA